MRWYVPFVQWMRIYTKKNLLYWFQASIKLNVVYMLARNVYFQRKITFSDYVYRCRYVIYLASYYRLSYTYVWQCIHMSSNQSINSFWWSYTHWCNWNKPIDPQVQFMTQLTDNTLWKCASCHLFLQHTREIAHVQSQRCLDAAGIKKLQYICRN